MCIGSTCSSMSADGKKPADAAVKGIAADGGYCTMQQIIPEKLRSQRSCRVSQNWSEMQRKDLAADQRDSTIWIVCKELGVTVHPAMFPSQHNPKEMRYGTFPAGAYTYKLLGCISASGELFVVKIPLDTESHLEALRCDFKFTKQIASVHDETDGDASCFAVNHEGFMQWQQDGERFQLIRPVGVSRYGGPCLCDSLGIIAQFDNVMKDYQEFCIKVIDLLRRLNRIHGDLHADNVVVRMGRDGRIQFTVIDFGLSKTWRMESGQKRVREEASDDVEELFEFVEHKKHGGHFDLPDEVRLVIMWISLMWVVNARSVRGGAGGSGAAGGAGGSGAVGGAGGAAARRFLLFGENGRQLRVKDLSTITRAMKALKMRWEHTQQCTQCRTCDVPTARCSCCMQELCRDKCMQNEETDSGDFFCIECSTATCNNPSCPSNPCTPLPADQEVAVVQASTNKLPCQLCFKWTCCLRDGKCVQCV